MNGESMNMRQGGPGGRRPPRSRHHGGSNPSNGGSSGNNSGGGRPQSRSPVSLRHQTFDSNGPDVRVRGNASQVYEKYLSLARDAQGAGNWVQAESLFQHAEHYYRLSEAINEATASEQRRPAPPVNQSYSGQQPEVPSNYYAPDGQLMDQQRAVQPQIQQVQPQPQIQQPQPQPQIQQAQPQFQPQPQVQQIQPQPQPDYEAQPQPSVALEVKREPRRVRTPRPPRPQVETKDPFFLPQEEVSNEISSGPQKLLVES